MPSIRNFSIIAHIDHGKSTLADRLLELTNTIPPRRMKDQVLDSMDLERERGITIKMAPVRMVYQDYILNLIDTPGHIDFTYEVSRSLKAVEGALLLVDATRGVQAQTLSVFAAAREQNLTIIPVINKIDLVATRRESVKAEIAKLFTDPKIDILEVSAKTGQGVEDLLNTIARRVPPPVVEYPATTGARALVFDFDYSSHRGLIVYARIFDGSIRRQDKLTFGVSGEVFTALEVGYFMPAKQSTEILTAGEIGYIVTGIKELNRAKVGETILKVGPPALAKTSVGESLPLIAGYAEPKPMVWASLYPASQDDFNLLRQALGRLKLSDAALSFEEETAGTLGRGFRAGFLGLLHLEIITERLRREHGLNLVVTAPSISFRLIDGQTDQTEIIYAFHLFPDELRNRLVTEPYALAEVLTPAEYLSPIIILLQDREAKILASDNWGESRMILKAEMPLRELMRYFFDAIKSVSSGFASLSYTLIDWRPADVVKLELLVAEEVVPALTRVVPRRRLEIEAEALVEKLKNLLPRELFIVKIQARVNGRIIASRSLSALKKDVTGYLYGGDITRKRKLWAKQAKGKKRMQTRARVNIAPEVFLKLVQ